jgi:hypothetical protein
MTTISTFISPEEKHQKR